MVLELRIHEVCAELVGRIAGGMRSGAWFEKKMSDRVEQKVLKWFGHVLHMSGER